jgi:Domain of unknown function (DUF4249)
MDLNFEGMSTEAKVALKKNALYALSLVWMVLLFFSCVPDPLPVNNLPQLKPKIVVASQIIPNQGLVVLLTRSVGALDASDESNPQSLLEQITINDALVTLRYAENIDTLALLESGLYGGVTIDWQGGIIYELRVKSIELGEVSAMTKVPEAIPFETAAARLYITEFDSLAEISYSLQDPAGENFYMVNVQKFSRTQQLASLLNPDVFTHLKDDAEFDGQLYQDQFRIFFRDFSKGDTVSVFLSNVQKDYYQFLKLRNDNRYVFADFASEPLNYNSNVKGGFGYFNLHVPDARVFVMQ